MVDLHKAKGRLFGDAGFFPALSADRFSSNNATFVAWMSMVPAAGGSAASIHLILTYGWSLIGVVTGRVPWRFSRLDLLLCLCCSALPAATLLTA